jgi:hypothetical protein
MPGKAPKISDMKKWEGSAADRKADAKSGLKEGSKAEQAKDRGEIAKAKSRGAPPFTKGKGARMRG